MNSIQADLFAEDNALRNRSSAADLNAVRARLTATLAQLEKAEAFPWSDPLDAVHEENRFQRGSEMLGDEGTALWKRFDRQMDRLYALQENT